MIQAYCPSCRYKVYTTKKWNGKDRYKFVCTCGCSFLLDAMWVKKTLEKPSTQTCKCGKQAILNSYSYESGHYCWDCYAVMMNRVKVKI